MASASVGDVAKVWPSGETLLPTKRAGDCSTAISCSQAMFVCKDGRNDATDGLLPRLDSEARMTSPVGEKSMSTLRSAIEFVRDMLGEVGGVTKTSKSEVSDADISDCLFPVRGEDLGATRGELTVPAVLLVHLAL